MKTVFHKKALDRTRIEVQEDYIADMIANVEVSSEALWAAQIVADQAYRNINLQDIIKKKALGRMRNEVSDDYIVDMIVDVETSGDTPWDSILLDMKLASSRL